MKRTVSLILVAALILVFSFSTLAVAQPEKEQVELHNGKVISVSTSSQHFADDFSSQSSGRRCPIEVPGS